MTEKTKKWSQENVDQLLAIVGSESPVSAASVESAAEQLGVSARSVAAKLRQLDREVASLAKEKVSAFSESEGVELAAFVNANPGAYTYKEIAEQFADGKFNHKQIQGKILALELTASVKPAEKVEVARAYTEAEEGKFVSWLKLASSLKKLLKLLARPFPLFVVRLLACFALVRSVLFLTRRKATLRKPVVIQSTIWALKSPR